MDTERSTYENHANRSSHSSSWGDYEPDGEMYVYDQCCQNCRYYGEEDGCKLYSREDFEQQPKTGWCCDWKGKRGGHW